MGGNAVDCVWRVALEVDLAKTAAMSNDVWLSFFAVGITWVDEADLARLVRGALGGRGDEQDERQRDSGN